MIPHSICAVDGSLYIPGDKASLMHATEGATGEPSDARSPTITGHPSRVLVIEAMGVLQSMKKLHQYSRYRISSSIHRANCIFGIQLQQGSHCIQQLSGSVAQEQNTSEKSSVINRVCDTLGDEAYHASDGYFILQKIKAKLNRNVCRSFARKMVAFLESGRSVQKQNQEP